MTTNYKKQSEKTYNRNTRSRYVSRYKFDNDSDDQYDHDKVERAMSRGRSRDSYGDYWNDRPGW